MGLRGQLLRHLGKLCSLRAQTYSAIAISGKMNTSSCPAGACIQDVTSYSPSSCVSFHCRRLFSSDATNWPPIADVGIIGPFKDLMAASWDEIPHAVLGDAEAALSKNTEDKAGQRTLADVLRAAVAVEQFAGVLVSLRMELDDSIGIGGEEVGPVGKDLQLALDAAYKRYSAYLDAFGPDEAYLRRKVEMELGTKMIQIKLRCGGLGSEWGKVTVLGTSGLAGSYVEHRAL